MREWGWGGRRRSHVGGDILTVAFLLDKSQLAGGSVRGQSDGIQIMSP